MYSFFPRRDIRVLSQKKNREFYNYFRKIVVKSAFFHNCKIQLFSKIVVKLKTKKRRFYNYFQQKRPILQLKWELIVKSAFF